MTVADVLGRLEAEQDPRGISHFAKLNVPNLRSYGIGLTKLRKLAKELGKDPVLARQLWETDVYEAKILGILADDPKQMTRAQVEAQADSAHIGMLAHVFCACDAPLAKAPFALDLALSWVDHPSENRRRCGWNLLGELSTNPKDKNLTDALYLPLIDRVERELQGEANFVKDAMNGFLLYVGQRNRALNTRAIAAARAIGKVTVDYGDNSCEATDVLKHLTGPHIQKKVGP